MSSWVNHLLFSSTTTPSPPPFSLSHPPADSLINNNNHNNPNDHNHDVNVAVNMSPSSSISSPSPSRSLPYPLPLPLVHGFDPSLSNFSTTSTQYSPSPTSLSSSNQFQTLFSPSSPSSFSSQSPSASSPPSFSSSPSPSVPLSLHFPSSPALSFVSPFPFDFSHFQFLFSDDERIIGKSFHIISSNWWKTFQQIRNQNKHHQQRNQQGNQNKNIENVTIPSPSLFIPIPPIDNSDISHWSDGCQILHSHLLEGENNDYVAINSVAYEYLQKRVGGGPNIRRFVISATPPPSLLPSPSSSLLPSFSSTSNSSPLYRSVDFLDVYPLFAYFLPYNEQSNRPELGLRQLWIFSQFGNLQNAIDNVKKQWGKPTEESRVWRRRSEKEEGSGNVPHHGSNSHFVELSDSLNMKWSLIPSGDLIKKIENVSLITTSVVYLMMEFKTPKGLWPKSENTNHYRSCSSLRVWTMPLEERGDEFSLGDFIDALDLKQVWHEGLIKKKEIREMEGKTKKNVFVFVHYVGFHVKWGEWIDSEGGRLAPRGTRALKEKMECRFREFKGEIEKNKIFPFTHPDDNFRFQDKIYKSDDEDYKRCCWCTNKWKAAAFLPCGHFHFCMECAEEIFKRSNGKCIRCGQNASEWVKISPN